MNDFMKGEDAITSSLNESRLVLQITLRAIGDNLVAKALGMNLKMLLINAMSLKLASIVGPFNLGDEG